MASHAASGPDYCIVDGQSREAAAGIHSRSHIYGRALRRVLANSRYRRGTAAIHAGVIISSRGSGATGGGPGRGTLLPLSTQV
jgi:hypothetical protein